MSHAFASCLSHRPLPNTVISNNRFNRHHHAKPIESINLSIPTPDSVTFCHLLSPATPDSATFCQPNLLAKIPCPFLSTLSTHSAKMLPSLALIPQFCQSLQLFSILAFESNNLSPLSTMMTPNFPSRSCHHHRCHTHLSRHRAHSS